jgi:uncharacterized membrane protein (DUF485 family)
MSQPQHEVVEKILHDPEFLRVISKRNAIAYSLTAIMLVCYFIFVVLLAYDPSLLASPMGNSTLGIPLGIGVIIIACILTGGYVFWANKHYDAQLHQLKARLANDIAKEDENE